MTPEDLSSLITTQDALRREYRTLQGDPPTDPARYALLAAADAAGIQRAEAQKGFTYPPSFRAFLKRYNGWIGFWPDWSLVGVPRDDTARLHDDVRRNLEMLPDVVGDDEMPALAEREKTDPSVILITNHPIFGTDMNGSFLVFDRNRVGADGEPEVAWVHYLQHVECRWPSFEALLRDAIEHTRGKLDALRAVPTSAASGAGGGGSPAPRMAPGRAQAVRGKKKSAGASKLSARKATARARKTAQSTGRKKPIRPRARQKSRGKSTRGKRPRGR